MLARDANDASRKRKREHVTHVSTLHALAMKSYGSMLASKNVPAIIYAELENSLSGGDVDSIYEIVEECNDEIERRQCFSSIKGNVMHLVTASVCGRSCVFRHDLPCIDLIYVVEHIRKRRHQYKFSVRCDSSISPEFWAGMTVNYTTATAPVGSSCSIVNVRGRIADVASPFGFALTKIDHANFAPVGGDHKVCTFLGQTVLSHVVASMPQPLYGCYLHQGQSVTYNRRSLIDDSIIYRLSENLLHIELKDSGCPNFFLSFNVDINLLPVASSQ